MSFSDAFCYRAAQDSTVQVGLHIRRGIGGTCPAKAAARSPALQTLLQGLLVPCPITPTIPAQCPLATVPAPVSTATVTAPTSTAIAPAPTSAAPAPSETTLPAAITSAAAPAATATSTTAPATTSTCTPAPVATAAPLGLQLVAASLPQPVQATAAFGTSLCAARAMSGSAVAFAQFNTLLWRCQSPVAHSQNQPNISNNTSVHVGHEEPRIVHHNLTECPETTAVMPAGVAAKGQATGTSTCTDAYDKPVALRDGNSDAAATNTANVVMLGSCNWLDECC